MNTAVRLFSDSHAYQVSIKHASKNGVFLMDFRFGKGGVVRELFQCVDEPFPEFIFREGKQVAAVF